MANPPELGPRRIDPMKMSVDPQAPPRRAAAPPDLAPIELPTPEKPEKISRRQFLVRAGATVAVVTTAAVVERKPLTRFFKSLFSKEPAPDGNALPSNPPRPTETGPNPTIKPSQSPSPERTPVNEKEIKAVLSNIRKSEEVSRNRSEFESKVDTFFHDSPEQPWGVWGTKNGGTIWQPHPGYTVFENGVTLESKPHLYVTKQFIDSPDWDSCELLGLNNGVIKVPFTETDGFAYVLFATFILPQSFRPPHQDLNQLEVGGEQLTAFIAPLVALYNSSYVNPDLEPVFTDKPRLVIRERDGSGGFSTNDAKPADRPSVPDYLKVVKKHVGHPIKLITSNDSVVPWDPHPEKTTYTLFEAAKYLFNGEKTKYLDAIKRAADEERIMLPGQDMFSWVRKGIDDPAALAKKATLTSLTIFKGSNNLFK